MSEENKKTATDLSRRRLAKAALVAAPVLAVLPGKPAMALYKKNNCTVSGNLSGNMSENVNNNDDHCDSLSPGYAPSYWSQNNVINNWPILNTNLFSDVFGLDSSSNDSSTLKSVMELGDGSLDAQALAAYLNSQPSVVPLYGMSTAEVLSSYDMYSPKNLSSTPHENNSLLATYVYLNSITGTGPGIQSF